MAPHAVHHRQTSHWSVTHLAQGLMRRLVDAPRVRIPPATAHSPSRRSEATGHAGVRARSRATAGGAAVPPVRPCADAGRAPPRAPDRVTSTRSGTGRSRDPFHGCSTATLRQRRTKRLASARLVRPMKARYCERKDTPPGAEARSDGTRQSANNRDGFQPPGETQLGGGNTKGPPERPGGAVSAVNRTRQPGHDERNDPGNR